MSRRVGEDGETIRYENVGIILEEETIDQFEDDVIW
jgi:hypothetical protein